ncbi:MAG: hypothetical protein K2Q06_13550 [Parvularculaceae bacterium]|nr:hypothetical protein [Parvularculaceae bacterium]
MAARRGVLKLLGGGVVVAATAGGGYAVLDRPSETAREPWRRAGRYDDLRKRALSYAILAPNPHNRQPWLVRLDADDALALYVDLKKRLPATDPLDRQTTLGCGAFLELLSIAAAEEGVGAEIKAFPEGEDPATLDERPIATVRFVKDAARRDPLFAHILYRRSNREVYEKRDVPAEALAALAAPTTGLNAALSVTGNTALAASLRNLTWRAHVRETATPAANQESVDLMRIGAAEVSRNPDGLVFEGAMIEVARRVGFVSREALADPKSAGFRQGLELYRAKAFSARAFGWIANGNASRADQIDAGRAYARMNLKATALGLSVHPWSQALQEYPEMQDLYREAHALIGMGATLQMLYRIGYAKPVRPAPRRALEAHFVQA